VESAEFEEFASDKVFSVCEEDSVDKTSEETSVCGEEQALVPMMHAKANVNALKRMLRIFFIVPAPIHR
jgi:hypothetical protein